MTRPRPYDRQSEPDVETDRQLMRRVAAWAEECRANGWHVAFAIKKLAPICPVCGTPWPCQVERKVRRDSRGKAAPTS